MADFAWSPEAWIEALPANERGYIADLQRRLDEAEKERDKLIEDWVHTGIADRLSQAERVVEAARECADDLAAEVQSSFGDPRCHDDVPPALQRRFERDMQPVNDLRQALDAYDALTPAPSEGKEENDE